MSEELWVYLLTGVLIGVIIVFILQRILSVPGTLYVDTSDPKKDLYRLSIDNLDLLSKKKRVILKVVKKKNASK